MAAKIILYQDTEFRGASREVTEDITDLSSIGFSNRVSSLKVVGSVWVGYEDPYFSGRQYVLEEGEFDNWRSWHGSRDELSSLKKLNLDVGETPQIVLYQHTNYSGRAVSFTYAIENLKYYKFDDEASSLRVKSGIWVLYQKTRYRGKQFVVTEGFYPHYDHWRGADDQISSLRPIREPYFPTEILSMEFHIDRGCLDSTCMSLVNLSQCNDTSSDQAASWRTTRTLTTTKTYRWNWKNTTVVKAGTTFRTGVPVIADGEITLGLSNTFAVGQSGGEDNTQSDEWSFNLPTSVKAKTLLRVQVRIQQGKIDVPFSAVMQKGNKRWEEVGTYHGTQSYNLHVDYKEISL
ncbi:epidermal differentiation-specific protein-like [Acanthaster planci]|uniref:Epidermal differentiation-specific protein-like n=1 Tax=Acanthaster planci TaxID=133434 RepID=A0A8B7Y4K2_ACAPL|nr:epidermal differentiation-specific protein-like [Acanthaster planci]